MHSKTNTKRLVLFFAIIVLLLTFRHAYIAQKGHILYYIPELELYIRLSPDWYNPSTHSSWKGEVICFSKDPDTLPHKNSKTIDPKIDYLHFPSSLNSVYIPLIYFKRENHSITMYSANGIPHSVVFPMEELFDEHPHHLPIQKQQELSELPSLMVYYSKTWDIVYT